MAFKRNNAEGASSGTTITTTNSDDSNAGDALDIATAGTRIYDSTYKHAGSTSFKLTGDASTAPILGWSSGNDDRGSFRCYFLMHALPASACAIVQARNAGNAGEIQIQSNGKISVRQSGGTLAPGFPTPAAALTIDTWYRLEYRVVKGADSTHGTIEFAYYLGDSLTPVESVYFTAGANTGTTNFEGFRWGKLTNSPAWDVWFDDVAWMPGGDALLGPVLGDPDIQKDVIRIVEVDTDGSNGIMTLEQTGGTDALSISGPDSGVFRIELPDQHPDVLTFELQAQADGPPITEEIKIEPRNLSATLVFQGGDATDIENWA